jgi:hypothetical protein
MENKIKKQDSASPGIRVFNQIFDWLSEKIPFSAFSALSAVKNLEGIKCAW